eukprot:CAMPEP_0183720206 /NCGR_PEP_ID=MMETSP0737-20130205/12897_1 /TAXON_ID=385413 /ORGANISM="Thalassiosira miniscula, Strain CCMP1093" /LENGTH=92 /DNA_ID=CAMNT_0025950043 /DNA_START=10 /DNA_END=285 /DNA_ORIENTATION=+
MTSTPASQSGSCHYFDRRHTALPSAEYLANIMRDPSQLSPFDRDLYRAWTIARIPNELTGFYQHQQQQPDEGESLSAAVAIPPGLQNFAPAS